MVIIMVSILFVDIKPPVIYIRETSPRIKVSKDRAEGLLDVSNRRAG
jgi:hypothetical protein